MQIDSILKRKSDVIEDFENSVPSARKRQLNIPLLFSDFFSFLGGIELTKEITQLQQLITVFYSEKCQGLVEYLGTSI